MNSRSPSGSSVQISCLCNPGFTGPNSGPCTACVAGEYKDVIGSASCTDCGAGKYLTTTGAATESSCVACPGNSNSVAGSDSIEWCYCNPGYRQSPGHNACIQCDPGFYDNTLNRYECSQCGGGLFSVATGETTSETCQPCSAGYYSDEGSAVCDLCPANSNSPQVSDSITDCTCNAGTTGSDGATCWLCPAGKYKATSGSAACLSCPGNSNPAAGSTACACNAGYELQGGLCVDCPVGKARQVNNNNSIVCETCGAGTFTSVSASSTCQSCSHDCSNVTFPVMNLAHTCSAGDCRVTISSSVASPAYDGSKAVDGITTLMPPNLGFISQNEYKPWLMINFEKTVHVLMVRLFNRPDCCQDRLVPCLHFKPTHVHSI